MYVCKLRALPFFEFNFRLIMECIVSIAFFIWSCQFVLNYTSESVTNVLINDIMIYLLYCLKAKHSIRLTKT